MAASSADRRILLEHLKVVWAGKASSLVHLTAAADNALELFAAWMATVRLCKKGILECPIHLRFPGQYTSMIDDYIEVQTAREDIVDTGTSDLSCCKLWQLFVFMFLGCGGAYFQPWKALKDYPEVKSFKQGQESQALLVLRYIRACLDESGLPLTSVIGGDGLDKKSRVSRETALLEWHAKVPQLVQAWQEGAFHDKLLELPFFKKGSLTQKELYCFFACSRRFPSLVTFGMEHMVCGNGAQQGANTFLAGHLPCHNDDVCLSVQESVSKYVADFATRTVTVADIETSLCACTWTQLLPAASVRCATANGLVDHALGGLSERS